MLSIPIFLYILKISYLKLHKTLLNSVYQLLEKGLLPKPGASKMFFAKVSIVLSLIVTLSSGQLLDFRENLIDDDVQSHMPLLMPDVKPQEVR